MALVTLLAVSIWCGMYLGGWLGGRIPMWEACIGFTGLSLFLNAKVFRTADSVLAPVAMLALGLMAQPVTHYSPAFPASYSVFLAILLTAQLIFGEAGKAGSVRTRSR